MKVIFVAGAILIVTITAIVIDVVTKIIDAMKDDEDE